jgi:fructose-specific phosphotransferase system IIC component
MPVVGYLHYSTSKSLFFGAILGAFEFLYICFFIKKIITINIFLNY